MRAINHTRTLGILGGMGPLATAHFLRRMVELTPVQQEQEHIPVVIWSDPRVPDRVAAVYGRGGSPVPALRHGIRALEQLGAGVAAVVCNTAHHWFGELVEVATIPLLHIADAALSQIPAACSTVGLLSTSATLHSGFYQRKLAEFGRRAVVPTRDEQQHCVLPAIAAVKRTQVTDASRLLESAATCLVQRGADVIVLACTELSIAWAGRSSQCVVDATDALAEACIAMCRDAGNEGGRYARAQS